MTNTTPTETELRDACLDLAHKVCATCLEGKCVLADKPCKQVLLNADYTIADGGINCDWFLEAVLPTDEDLHRTIKSLIEADRDMWDDDKDDDDDEDDEANSSDAIVNLRKCNECGRWFMPSGNRQQRCRECGTKSRHSSNAAAHRRMYWRDK